MAKLTHTLTYMSEILDKYSQINEYLANMSKILDMKLH